MANQKLSEAKQEVRQHIFNNIIKDVILDIVDRWNHKNKDRVSNIQNKCNIMNFHTMLTSIDGLTHHFYPIMNIAFQHLLVVKNPDWIKMLFSATFVPL